MYERLKKLDKPLGCALCLALMVLIGLLLLLPRTQTYGAGRSSQVILESRISSVHDGAAAEYKLVFVERTSGLTAKITIPVDQDTYDSYRVGDRIFKPSRGTKPGDVINKEGSCDEPN